MCSALLEETGIAILPGCEFGRDPSELTARIAFVDFDGGAALKAANQEYLDKDINKAFIHTYAPDLVKALKRLSGWLSSL